MLERYTPTTKSYVPTRSRLTWNGGCFFGIASHPCELTAAHLGNSCQELGSFYTKLSGGKQDLSVEELSFLDTFLKKFNLEKKAFLDENQKFLDPKKSEALQLLITLLVAFRFLQAKKGRRNGVAEGLVYGVGFIFIGLCLLSRLVVLMNPHLSRIAGNKTLFDVCIHVFITLGMVPILLNVLLRMIPALNITRTYHDITRYCKTLLLEWVGSEGLEKIKQLKYSEHGSFNLSTHGKTIRALEAIICEDKCVAPFVEPEPYCP